MKALLLNSESGATQRQRVGRATNQFAVREQRENATLINIAPLVVICFTNHALDQFLEEVIDAGIDEADVIRIGSRSKSERMERRNLKKIKPDPTQEERRQFAKLKESMTKLEVKCCAIAKQCNVRIRCDVMWCAVMSRLVLLICPL